MLTHELEVDDGILFLTPHGSLQKSDFEAVAREVDPFIKDHGDLAGILIDAASFPGWENFAALLAHLRFVRDHHRHVKRIAAVSDSRFLTIMPKLAKHFVSAEIRHFPHDQRGAALEWLRGA